MARLAGPQNATHTFHAAATKPDSPTEMFLYYVIEPDNGVDMTVKDAVREIEAEGWTIRSSETRPVKDRAAVQAEAAQRFGVTLNRRMFGI